MDISVLIPVYNVEKYIERCLKSLFEQTKTNDVEFIIVNDCSPDNSMAIVRKVVSKYPHLNIKIIEHKINCGISVVRQTGLDAMIGEYTIQVDSDDWCEPSMLEELFLKAKESDADVVCCDYFADYNNEQRYVKHIVPFRDGIKCAELLLLYKLYGHLVTKFIRRSLYTENNIGFCRGINYGEDLLVSIKLFSMAKNVHYLQRAYYHYVQTNMNAATKKYNVNNIEQSCVLLPLEVEKFIKSKSKNAELGEIVEKHKLLAKFAALQNANLKDRSRFANIHPEVNHKICTMSHLSKAVRFGLIQATKGRVYIFNIILWSCRLKTEIKSALATIRTYQIK